MTVREAKNIFYNPNLVLINPWTPGAIFDVKMLGWSKSWWFMNGNRKILDRDKQSGLNTNFEGRFVIRSDDLPKGYYMLDYNTGLGNSRFIRPICDIVHAVMVNGKEIIIGDFNYKLKHIAWFQMIRSDEFVADPR